MWNIFQTKYRAKFLCFGKPDTHTNIRRGYKNFIGEFHFKLNWKECTFFTVKNLSSRFSHNFVDIFMDWILKYREMDSSRNFEVLTAHGKELFRQNILCFLPPYDLMKYKAPTF